MNESILRGFLLARLSWLLLVVLAPLSPAKIFASSHRPESFVLPNGLRVVIKKDSSSPLTALQLWVEAGAADEEAEEAGLAHLLEHVLFRGSSETGTGKLAGEVEGLGGRMNGFTSRDHTVYHMVLPSPHFRTGLSILARMAHLPALEESQLQKEIQVVLEEWKQGQDNPRSQASSALFKAVYQLHPYGRPVIGDPEALRRMTWEMVSSFYRRWYAANNMILVLVGDLDWETAKGAAEEFFANFSHQELPVRRRPAEPEQQEPRLHILKAPIRQPRLIIGFPTPGATAPEAPALDLLAFILGRGEGSRLAKRVKISAGLVNSISASTFSSKGPGIFSVEAQLETEKITEGLSAIFQEIYRLHEEPVGPSELQRAHVNFARSFVESGETMQGQANQLGRMKSVYDDPNYEKSYLEQIRAVDTARIRTTARTFLTTEKLSVVLLVPEGASQLPDAGQISSLSRSARNLPARSLGQDHAGVLRVSLDNGLRILIQENHRLPAFTIRAEMVGGRLLESEANNGIHNFIAAMLTQGTPSLSSSLLVDEVEHLGGRLNGSAGDGMLSLTGTFPSQNAERGLEIFLDVLLRPSFPETELEKKRQEILTQIRNQEEQIRNQAFRFFYRGVFRNHPYRLDPLGQTEVVRRFKRGDLATHYQKLISAERMVVSVVGDVDAEKILKRLRSRLSSLQRGAEPFSPPAPEDGVDALRVEKKIVRSKQAHLVLGFPAPTKAHSDYFAMKVLQMILSGIGGRLFVSLRDNLGLAYSVSAFALDDPHQGAFGVYAATDPAAVEKMTEGILAELRRVQDEEVSPDELARAKRSITGNYLISRQTNSFKAADLTFNELFGFGTDFGQRYQEGIEKVTAADIQRFTRQYLPLDRYVLAIVGP